MEDMFQLSECNSDINFKGQARSIHWGIDRTHMST